MATEKLLIELDAKTDKADAKLKTTKKAVDDLGVSAENTDTKIKNTGVQAESTGGKLKGMGHRAGQLGFQLQDVAVQAQSGTSAFVILGQQGSQIASVFGPGGAVIGAIIAVGSAILGVLVTSLLKGGDSLNDFKEKLHKTTEAQIAFLNATSESTRVDALKVQLDKLGSSIDEQTKKMTKAREAISAYRDNMGGSLDEVKQSQNAIDAQNSIIEKSESRIKELNKAMAALSESALPEMTDGVTIANNAAEAWVQTLKMQSDIMGKTKSEIVEQTAATLTLNDEQKQIVDTLVAQLKAEEDLREARKLAIEEERDEKKAESEAEATQREIEKLQEFIMTRAELLDQQLLDDLERLALAGEELGVAEEDQYARRLEIIQDFADKKAALESKKTKVAEKENKQEERDARDKELSKLDTQQNAIRAGMALNTAFFEDNKAIAAGLIVADTATAIMKSLTLNPYDYVNVAIIAATGAIQLANALSSSKGGGSTSAASGGSSSTQQESFNPEQSAIGLDFRSESAQTTNMITFNTETGDQLIDALAGMLNENMRQGRG
jgi:hypothetical protein